MEWDNVYSTADADPVFWSEESTEPQSEVLCLTVNLTDCQSNLPLQTPTHKLHLQSVKKSLKEQNHG